MKCNIYTYYIQYILYILENIYKIYFTYFSLTLSFSGNQQLSHYRENLEDNSTCFSSALPFPTQTSDVLAS